MTKEESRTFGKWLAEKRKEDPYFMRSKQKEDEVYLNKYQLELFDKERSTTYESALW